MTLFVGFIVFMIIAYKVSFKKTFEYKRVITEKEDKIIWLSEKEKEIPFLKAQMALVEKNYSSKDSTSIRDKLTAYISDFAENNNCTVTEIPVSKDYTGNNLKVETNTFTIEGAFKDLLTLEHQLEEEFKVITKIMSIRFFSVKNNQTKRKHLSLSLITQSFNEIELNTPQK